MALQALDMLEVFFADEGEKKDGAGGWQPSPRNPARVRKRNASDTRWRYKDAGGEDKKAKEEDPSGKKKPGKEDEDSQKKPGKADEAGKKKGILDDPSGQKKPGKEGDQTPLKAMPNLGKKPGAQDDAEKPKKKMPRGIPYAAYDRSGEPEKKRKLGFKERHNIKDHLVGHGKAGPHDLIHQDKNGDLWLHKHDKDKPQKLGHPDHTEGFDPHDLSSYSKLTRPPREDGQAGNGGTPQLGGADKVEPAPHKMGAGGVHEMLHPAHGVKGVGDAAPPVLGDKDRAAIPAWAGAPSAPVAQLANPAHATSSKDDHAGMLNPVDALAGPTGGGEDNRSAPTKPKGERLKELLGSAFGGNSKETAKYFEEMVRNIPFAQLASDAPSQGATGSSSGQSPLADRPKDGQSMGQRIGSMAAKALNGLAWGADKLASVAYFVKHPISGLLGSAFTQASKLAESERQSLESRYGKAASHLINASATLIAAVQPPGVSHAMAYWAPGRWLSRLPALVLAEGVLQGGRAAKYLGGKAADGISKAYSKLSKAVGHDQKDGGKASLKPAPSFSQDDDDDDDDKGAVSLSAAQIQRLAQKLAEKVCGHFMKHAQEALSSKEMEEGGETSGDDEEKKGEKPSGKAEPHEGMDPSGGHAVAGEGGGAVVASAKGEKKASTPKKAGGGKKKTHSGSTFLEHVG